METVLIDTTNSTTNDFSRSSLPFYIFAHTPVSQPETYEGRSVFVQTHNIDGRYFADMLMGADLPHHGEGSTPDEAMSSLFEALKASWKALHSARKLSKHMEKRKLRLDDLFNQAFTGNL